tara:strand:- start:1606 stop:2766 length:1161 start_codon:yes stop_codon:yes gene_type:complete
MKHINSNERLYLLDISRVFAATCVVLQHYQHFYYISPNNLGNLFLYSEQPFIEYIEFAYKFGTVAVQFFFILSGFIFFYFYKKKIFEKKVNFKDFLILRISRLYPLHFLTLLLMLFFQKIYYNIYSDYFVYPNNSIENFISHFFLVQEWGFLNLLNLNINSGFNQPAWSISVELFAYLSFFVVSLFFIKNFFESLFFLLLVILAHILIQPSLGNLSVGIILFYLGGSTFFLSSYIKSKLKSYKKIILFSILFIDFLVFGRFLNSIFLELQNYLIGTIGDRIMLLLFFIKFPLLIINLDIIQFYFKNLGKSFKIFGDLSYTIYLIHVPIQIIIMFVHKSIFNIEFNNELFFIIYFLIIFGLSGLVFKYYEHPAKVLLRNKFINIYKN